MGTLLENVAAAGDAMRYTNGRLWRGGVNRPEGVRQFLGAVACMAPTRVLGVQTERQRAADLTARLTGNQLQQILALGEASEPRGCGHCGEMSAVAFRYLYLRGITPIEYINVRNFDHAFVVIGREVQPGMPEPQQMDPASWGPVAAVCDPHQRNAYPAVELRVRMRPGNGQFEVIVRHPRYCPPPVAFRAHHLDRLRPARLLGPR